MDRLNRIHAPPLMALAAMLATLVLVACGGSASPTQTPNPPATTAPSAIAPTATVTQVTAEVPDIEFTLETALGQNGMVFRGVGGTIDGIENPDLMVEDGATVKITLVNGDGVMHDIEVPDFSAHSATVTSMGEQVSITFSADQVGEFPYYCAIPGHRISGMEGNLLVGDVDGNGGEPAVSIVRHPTDLPGPISNREPATVRVDLEAVELVGELADGTTYTYWTFNGQVPGPLLRVRVGDMVEVHFTNRSDSTAVHSVDFHAATGAHGGGAVSQIAPGDEAVFTFRALTPGVFVYHCATPSVAHHIASGMYGMIIVEPEGGLREVDKEFYVMQGEIYTADPYGTTGHMDFSHQKMLAEDPEYFVFNGADSALAQDEYALRASVGETVRIYFGVGGPNHVSSFHVIGEIFDRVYDQASITSPPLTDVQTTLVPPGGATVVEFHLEVPGSYVLVDHALSRLERGLVGILHVEGEENPDVFRDGPAD